MSFGYLLLIIVLAYVLGLLTMPLLVYIRLTVTDKSQRIVPEEPRST
jgi:hypothetical protein